MSCNQQADISQTESDARNIPVRDAAAAEIFLEYMATENINVKDLAAVDVMDNHQPIKALEDISFSQNPAINIRLKQDAKTRWAGTMKVGAGTSPFLWNDELFAMRLTHKMQTLNSYKTNNIGTDVTKDATDFTMDDSRNPFSKSYNMLCVPRRSRTKLNPPL